MVELQSSKLVMRVRFPLPAPIMNVSYTHKAILWLPQRTASRTIAGMFLGYDFINTEHNTPLEGENFYTHDLGFPPNTENFDLICTVRNPYSWLLSVWHWDNFYPGVAEKDRISFAEYVKRQQWELIGFSNHIVNANIKYLIRYESIKQDLAKIPWFNINRPEVNYRLTHNGCMSENLIRTENMTSDYLKYYTEKEFSIVNTKLSDLFDKLGYIKISCNHSNQPPLV